MMPGFCCCCYSGMRVRIYQEKTIITRFLSVLNLSFLKESGNFNYLSMRASLPSLLCLSVLGCLSSLWDSPASGARICHSSGTDHPVGTACTFDGTLYRPAWMKWVPRTQSSEWHSPDRWHSYHGFELQALTNLPRVPALPEDGL